MSHSEVQSMPVTINGFTRPTHFSFSIYDVWNADTKADTGIYVFVENPSLPMTELLDVMSVWGGASKRHPDNDKILGWERPVAFGPHIAWLKTVERRWNAAEQSWYYRRTIEDRLAEVERRNRNVH